MQIDHVLSHYGKQILAARAIEISPQLMSKLARAKKAIPIEYQIKWEVATGGALKADLPNEVRETASA